MRGESDLNLVVGDADALIALVHQEDVHHDKVLYYLRCLSSFQTRIIFPLTAIAEAVTTVQRKMHSPTFARTIIEHVEHNTILMSEVDRATFNKAITLFKPQGSKQNTIHDAIVASMAKQLNTTVVFSFDAWYRTVGLKLIIDVVEYVKTN